MRIVYLLVLCLGGWIAWTPTAGAAESDAYAGPVIRAARPACKRSASLVRPSAAGADGPTSDWSISGNVGWYSQYAWRGQLPNDEPVLQPSVTVGWRELSVNLWANFDLTDSNGREGELNEIDYTVDWTHRFEDTTFPWSLSLGIIHYTFPNTSFDATTELYAVVSSELPLNPTLSLYYDFGEIDGTYAALDFSHDVRLSDCASLAVGAGLGWGDRGYNRGYWGVADPGWNDVHLSAAVPITLGSWTVTPGVTYYSVVDEMLRDSTRDPDNVVFSINVSFSPN